MFKIKTFNYIDPDGLAELPQDIYQVDPHCNNPDAILLRSHTLLETDIPSSVKIIARAGAGTNNIPVSKMTECGVPVLNTPGANANAVKELVITGLLLSCRNICQAWDYSRHLQGDHDSIHEAVEKNKKQFKGIELPGRTLGVVGLGQIGVKVANAAIALGMQVIGYDPAMTIENAWQLSSQVKRARNLQDLLRHSQFVTVHVPLLAATKYLINQDALVAMPNNSVLLNFARREIVEEDAVFAALQQKHLAAYVCDFPNPKLQQQANVICLPHLGASTIEAERNCAIMAAQQIRDFLELGNIKYSVNFPRIEFPLAPERQRIAISNRNVPDMLAQISKAFAEEDINILDMLNQSRETIAYTLIDIEPNNKTSQVLQSLLSIDGILNARAVA